MARYVRLILGRQTRSKGESRQQVVHHAEERKGLPVSVPGPARSGDIVIGDTMAEKWYDSLPDDFFESEADKAYREAFAKIRAGLEQGLGFDEACKTVEVKDEVLRKQIIDDMLKVILAEEHFAKKISVEDLAKKLKVSVEFLDAIKQIMFHNIAFKDA